jgi:hypothetical protein
VDKLHDIAWDHIPVPDHNPLYAQTSLDFLASYPMGTGGTSMLQKCCIQLVRMPMTDLSTCTKYVIETAVNGKERDKLFLGKSSYKLFRINSNENTFRKCFLPLSSKALIFHFTYKHLNIKIYTITYFNIN